MNNARFGYYKINGISVVECLGCGRGEPVKHTRHRKLFRARHAVCFRKVRKAIL